ncbi:MAG: SDR family NAD(P)-dependent oxidoreductase [Myxococcota bacterium]
MKRIEGRVAVVTGAASGIGRATAQRLAERGCSLALADLDRDGLEAAAHAIAATGATVSTTLVDVASAPAMEAFSRAVEARHGAVHILVNNAGVALVAPFAEQRLDDLAWLVGVNYWGVVHGCHFFLPLLRRQDEGHIVNLSSMFGFLGLPGQSGYCATKAAVRALSESLWAELRGERIGVSSVHPGCIGTSIIRASRVGDEAVRRDVQDFFDRRGAPPDAVARAILRAIERDRLFVRVRPESFATDWLKRLLPVGVHRAIARRWTRRPPAASEPAAAPARGMAARR